MKIQRPKVVERAWGVEEWIANGAYCAKRLIIPNGQIIRFHSHKKKHETFYVDSGSVKLGLDSEQKVLKKGDIVEVPAGYRHKVMALKDSVIIEASTHHEDADSYFHSAIFLDRDGVINKDLGAEIYKKDGTFDLFDKDIYLRRPEDIVFEENAIEGMKRLIQMEFRLIIVTNQAGIGRGLLTEAEVDSVHEAMLKILSENGIEIEKVYMCPHDEGEGKGRLKRRCENHKPRPGFLYNARQDLDIDLSESFMVGDKLQDVMAGNLAGCRAVLMDTGWGGHCLEDETMAISMKPDFVAKDLLELAETLAKTF